MVDLNKKLNELKRYSNDISISKLNKRIYTLDLTEKYLKTLSKQELQYIHVKLHNALSYKKPFSDLININKVHDRMAKLLQSHQKIDELDNKKQKV